jgi:hypothetical protein
MLRSFYPVSITCLIFWLTFIGLRRKWKANTSVHVRDPIPNPILKSLSSVKRNPEAWLVAHIRCYSNNMCLHGNGSMLPVALPFPLWPKNLPLHYWQTAGFRSLPSYWVCLLGRRGMLNTEKEEKRWKTWRLILREGCCKLYGRDTEKISVTTFAVILDDTRRNKSMGRGNSSERRGRMSGTIRLAGAAPHTQIPNSSITIKIEWYITTLRLGTYNTDNG